MHVRYKRALTPNAFCLLRAVWLCNVECDDLCSLSHLKPGGLKHHIVVDGMYI